MEQAGTVVGGLWWVEQARTVVGGTGRDCSGWNRQGLVGGLQWVEQDLSADWNSHSLYLLHAQVCRLALAVLIAESLLLPLPPPPLLHPPAHPLRPLASRLPIFHHSARCQCGVA